MSWFDAMRFRAKGIRRDRLEDEFDEEVRFHLEQATQQHEARGLSREAAAQAARREFGISSTVKEDLREARGINLVDAFLQDVRHGARLLLRNRGYATSALLTIALGIGATTAVFTVVYGVVLRPLPYPDQGRLVSIWMTAPKMQLPRAFVTAANYRDWRAQSTSFESIALVRAIGNFNLTGSGEPQRLLGARVTASLFDVLGTPPALGRPFRPEEEEDGREFVVILSDGLWTQRFGRDPGVIGRGIILNGSRYEVIGVMPPSFSYPGREFQLWVPLTVDPEELRTRLGGNFRSVGRLRPGVSIAAAQAEMDGISRNLGRQYPASNADTGVLLEPMQSDLVRDVRRPLMLLLAAVASLLLIGCASLANLLIARAVTRSGELVLRSALGATRGRLIRQSLTELLPLLVIGGAAGLLLARLLLDVAIPLLPATMPRVEGIAIGMPILLFAGAMLALTAVIAGVWPALQVARWDVAAALRESLRGASTTLRGGRLRDALVVAQIAVALLLTISAALLARSFGNIRSIDAGFRPEGVVSVHLAIPRTKYTSDERVAAVSSEILEAVRQVPGVASAGMVNRLPLAGVAQIGVVQMEGTQLPDNGVLTVDWRSVSPDYFRTMSIPIVEGRVFTDADDSRAQRVGVIDEQLARAAWPGRSAIGRRFRVPLGTDQPWMTIVGVVGHIHHDGLDSAGRPQVYWNYRQRPQDRMALVVRTDVDPSAIMRSLIAAIRSVDPEQAVYDARPMTEVVERSVGQQWLTAAVLGVFAVVSLLMAAIGVYGVVAYTVRQRAREFSVRMALGADKKHVLLMVVRRGAMLVGSGVLIGGAASLLATRWLGSMLHGVSARDVPTFAAAIFVLTGAALLATIVPARRAVRVEPMAVLRGD